VTVPRVAGNLPESTWADDHVTVAEERQATDPGLASLPYIGAALRRGAWLWCLMAAVGLAVGLGLKLVLPPAYQASTSILLVYAADENPADAILTDISLAQSQAVATGAMRKLGLRQNLGSFLTSYTVTQLTDRLIRITVTAPASNEAVARARALATEFLHYRANELQAQQQLTTSALDQRIAQVKHQVAEIGKLVAAAKTTPDASPLSTPSPGQTLSPAQKKLRDLNNRYKQEVATLAGLEQAKSGYPVGTASMVQGSQVLDAAAPVHRSHLRLIGTYAAVGLVAGLALGLGIVIAQALVSVRLRRRDDVARALDTPVDLSVGGLQARWLPGRRSRGRDQKRMVAHLRDAVPARPGGAASLAVVAVDNARAVAPSLVALAMACAQEGRQVVVADLAGGAPAARLLGAGKPGIRPVRVNGTHLVVAVPGRDNVVPVGPVPPASPRAQLATPSEALTAAYASADLLLTLVTLDPALGGDHLATWATGAVAVVTAGRSSWTRINAVGEMIRLAGTSLVSTVLIGADKTDESLGTAYIPEEDGEAGVREVGASAKRRTSVGLPNGGPNGGRAQQLASEGARRTGPHGWPSRSADSGSGERT